MEKHYWINILLLSRSCSPARECQEFCVSEVACQFTASSQVRGEAFGK